MPISTPLDPTENVKALNKAGIKSLRDVLTVEICGIRREIESQATLVDKVREIDRANQALIDERLQASIERLEGTIELTAKTLSAQGVETATTLSLNVTDTAKALASQHAAQFDRLSQQHTASFERLSEKVASLERVQIQGAGQAGVRDPQIDALMAQVATIQAQQLSSTGKQAGLSLGVSILIGLLGAAGMITGLISWFGR